MLSLSAKQSSTRSLIAFANGRFPIELILRKKNPVRSTIATSSSWTINMVGE